MEENTNVNETLEGMETMFTISNHAKQRYAERIAGREELGDINRFIVNNESKILTDINKMVYYGEKIYTGKQSQTQGKGKVIDVYLKDTWVILVDGKDDHVVTLYKVDLKLGEDFNKQYVSKMMERLEQAKADYVTDKNTYDQENLEYKKKIEEAEIQIKKYKTLIKSLEEATINWKGIIDHNNLMITTLEDEVADVVNTLVGKKEF